MRQEQNLFATRTRSEMHRQGQGTQEIRVRQQGVNCPELQRHHRRRSRVQGRV